MTFPDIFSLEKTNREPKLVGTHISTAVENLLMAYNYNSEHEETFKSILKLYTLPKEMAEVVAYELCRIDKDKQDALIKTLTGGLLKTTTNR